jgi:hypothetical protein
MKFFLFFCFLNSFNDFLSNFKDYKFSSTKSFYCQDSNYKRVTSNYCHFFSFPLKSPNSELIYGGKFTKNKFDYVIFEEYFPDGVGEHSPDGSFIYFGTVDKKNKKIVNIVKVAEDHLRESYNLIFFDSYILVRKYKTSGPKIRFMDMPKNKALVTDFQVVFGDNGNLKLKKNNETKLVSYTYNENICNNGVFIVD